MAKVGSAPRHGLIRAAIVSAVAFWVYYRLLSPSVQPGDSAEYAIVADTLGIAHSPGYPMFTMLGFVFSQLPIGDIAFRLNLMSAVFASACVGSFYLLLLKLISYCRLSSPRTDEVVAIPTSLVLGLGPALWYNAEMASVRTFETFFFLLTLLAAFYWRSSQKPRALYMLGLAYGSSLVAHSSMVLYLPSVLLLTIPRHWRSVGRRPALLTLLFSLLPLLLYLYLPIRSAQDPAFRWARVSDLGALIAYVRGEPFSYYRFALPISSTPSLVQNLVEILRINISAAIGFTLPLGLYWLSRHERRILLAVTTIVISNCSYFMYYLNAEPAMFLPSIIVILLVSALGLAVIFRHLMSEGMRWPKPVLPRRLMVVALALVLVSSPVFFHQRFRSSVDQSHSAYSEYARNALLSVRSHAVIVTSYWGTIFQYQQIVYGVRRDVKIQYAFEGDWRNFIDGYLAQGESVYVPFRDFPGAKAYLLIPALTTPQGLGLFEVSSPSRVQVATLNDDYPALSDRSQVQLYRIYNVAVV